MPVNAALLMLCNMRYAPRVGYVNYVVGDIYSMLHCILHSVSRTCAFVKVVEREYCEINCP